MPGPAHNVTVLHDRYGRRLFATTAYTDPRGLPSMRAQDYRKMGRRCTGGLTDAARRWMVAA